MDSPVHGEQESVCIAKILYVMCAYFNAVDMRLIALVGASLSKPERAPHWRVAHTRFVVDSVREKYKQIRQITLQVYHNTVSMQYTLGAINHDTERIFVLSTITRNYVILAWCYQP